MANEFIYIQGMTKWFRPENPNEWGKWSHVIYPKDEDLEKIRELQSQGVKNVLKKDEDGYYLTIGRATEIRRKVGGIVKIVGMAPPIIIDKEGQPMNNANVGNGSTVTSKIQVYEHPTPGGGKAKAMRWVSSRIDNLIPFEPNKDQYPEEAKATAGLVEQPAPDKEMF